MRLVCVADAHVHPWRLQSHDGGHDRLMDGLSVVRQSLELARAVDAAWVFAGDMKQPKTSWPQSALTGLLAVFRDFPDVVKVMVAGNHDAEGEGGSGLSPFRDVATVVETVQTVEFRRGGRIVCCPWNGDPAEAARQVIKNQGGVLVAHGFLAGCLLGPEDTRIAKGTPVGAFGPFDLGIFGDVHKAQWRKPAAPPRHAEWLETGYDEVKLVKGAAFYCGSPYQQNWGERNDAVKGALVVDTERGTAAMAHLAAPRYVHLELDYESLGAYLDQLHPDDGGDFVRVVYSGAMCGKTDQLRKWGDDYCRSFQMIVRPLWTRAEGPRSEVHAGMSTREMLEGYMKVRPPGGDMNAARTLDAGLRLSAPASG